MPEYCLELLEISKEPWKADYYLNQSAPAMVPVGFPRLRGPVPEFFKERLII